MTSISGVSSCITTYPEPATHHGYTFIRDIGKGTYSTVFLAKNYQGDLVAVKEYEITDPQIITLLQEQGISPATYVKTLAEQELEIGSLTDHPNLIKIRESWQEGSKSYVVMDLVEGKCLDTIEDLEQYPQEIRSALVKQFLSAIEHLLLRNIIIDDLWSGNMMISHRSHLMLIDLGGYDKIFQNPDLPLAHYLEGIERMLTTLGGITMTPILERCAPLLPPNLREEIIAPSHVKVLVSWIEALQKELKETGDMSHTLSNTTTEETSKMHAMLSLQHPHHISFNTAQNSQFLAYSLIAHEALEQFHPGQYPDDYLKKTHLIRYPFSTLPKSLEHLFHQFPIREDYDTASGLVGNALISVSPSLIEKEGDESAWAIFEENGRDSAVAEYAHAIFDHEKVSSSHFKEQIQNVVEETPNSKHGLLYTFFLPKDSPLHRAVYLSKAYGIPEGDPLNPKTVFDFYESYKPDKTNNPQLRFLPSALTPENHFDLKAIKSYRFTSIPQEEIHAYQQKVEKVVKQIFQDHLEEMLSLATFAAQVETSQNPEQQKGYEILCQRHLQRHDVQLALYYWNKIEAINPHKVSYLPGIIACLMEEHKWTQAKRFFEENEALIPMKEHLIARFAFNCIEEDKPAELDLWLEKLPESPLKESVWTFAGTRYPKYAGKEMLNAFCLFLTTEELIALIDRS